MVTDEEIKRFESIFPIVRRQTGWSQEVFGEKIGLSRQAINNIENKKNNLTKTVYIASRFVIDEEMEAHPNGTEMLRLLLDAIVDNPETYTQKQRDMILKKADLLSQAIQPKHNNRGIVNKEMKDLLIGLGCITAAAVSALAIGLWKKRI